MLGGIAHTLNISQIYGYHGYLANANANAYCGNECRDGPWQKKNVFQFFILMLKLNNYMFPHKYLSCYGKINESRH